jgi:hypothetical protein
MFDKKRLTKGLLVGLIINSSKAITLSLRLLDVAGKLYHPIG